MENSTKEPKFGYFRKKGCTTEEYVDLLTWDIISKSDTWITDGGIRIVSLRGFEKIAYYEKITQKSDFKALSKPSKNSLQQHWIQAWYGFRGEPEQDKWVCTTGESSILNTGKIKNKKYIEWGEIDASYRGAMAEKRLFCRAIQKLLPFTENVYADIEAKAFKKTAVVSETAAKDENFTSY